MGRSLVFKVCSITLLGAMTLTVQAQKLGWSKWRGPNADGISTESKWNPKAVQSPKVKWQANLGKGHSAVAIDDSNLYTMGNNNNTDTIYCFSAKTGKKKWSHDYKCGAGSYPGPRATPVVSAGMVYTLSREGHALCLDGKTGKVKWEKNLCRMGAQNIGWGLSGSPLVSGKAVIYNAGATGIALDKKTGAKLWGSSGKGGYAVPVRFKGGGKTALAMFSQNKLISVELKTGKQIWSFPWKTSYDVNAADPVLCGDDKIFIGSGYGRGCAMVTTSGQKLWENKNMKAHFSTPVYLDGHLYGVDGNTPRGSLVCLDAKTGNVKWKENTGFGQLMVANGVVIFLNVNGMLYTVKASPSYSLIAKGQTPLRKICWTMPILCNGLIYCRNDKGLLVAIDVSK